MLLEIVQERQLKTSIQLLPILLLPPAILLNGMERKRTYQVALAFSIACNLALMVDLGIGLSRMIAHLDSWNIVPAKNFLFYNKLSYLIPGQAHYFALYLSLAFFISLHKASENFTWGKVRGPWLISALMHLVGIGLLAARAQILAFGIVVISFLVILAFRRKDWKFNLILTAGIVVLLGAVVVMSPRSSQRLKEMKDKWVGMQQDEHGNLSTRVYIWRSSAQLLEGNLLKGLGVHQAYPKLWTKAQDDLDRLLKFTSPSKIAGSRNPIRHEVLSYRYRDVEGIRLMDLNNIKVREGMRGQLLWKDDSCERNTVYRIQTKGNHRIKGGFQVLSAKKPILGIRDELGNPNKSDQFFSCTDGPLELVTARFADSELDVDSLSIIQYSISDEQMDAPDPLLWRSAETFLHRLLGHNQYMDLLMRFGLIGLILFAAGFISMTYNAVERHNNLLLVFIGLIAISFVFEHMMNRQAGIFFIPMFLSLLAKLTTTQEER
jgi:O-antigen ligase